MPMNVENTTTPMEKIAVIDVETTGLSPWRHDRIVEIAIVIISPDGTIHAEFESLINPKRDMGPTQIHQISAADVLQAPTFFDVAGDILEILKGVNIIAGHNVSFDKNFLAKEYERLGFAIPDIPVLCTCRLFGRSSLMACCEELDIPFEGLPHRALTDARATARIISFVCDDDPTILDNHRIDNAAWPSIPALGTLCFCREHAQEIQNETPKFLQRISSNTRHDVEAQTPNILAYMALIDRVLEDRVIDTREEETLVDAVMAWELSPAQLDGAHKQYVHNLVIAALADGIVTETERRDLHIVSKLLGQEDSTLDALIESARKQLAFAQITPEGQNENSLCGQRVCFTGAILSKIDGEHITRALAETLATQAGLTVVSGVTKKLDILVVADPNTQSGKATKARKYGTRILSDAVFWRLAGIAVD